MVTNKYAAPHRPGRQPGDSLAVPGFPGNAVTGVCMLVAPIALAILCLLGIGIYKYDGHDFLAAMAAHRVRAEIFLNFVPLAVIMLMLAALGLAGLATRTTPRLARLGGVCALLGLCGPIFFLGIEFAGYQVSSPRYLAAGAYMYDQANMVPRVSINISGLALIVGFISLAIAAYRAGLLDRVRAVCFGLAALLPVGFISAVLVVSAIGFAACAVALVPLGLAVLRGAPVAAESRPSEAASDAVPGAAPDAAPGLASR
ncbi:MAG TPA: hypothetical protein VFI30_04810 [Nocardioidaceae bacterium]|nr:hypothetical protein [Nocardioidaceae bacterium]